MTLEGNLALADSLGELPLDYVSLLDEKSSCQDDLQITTVATANAF